MNSQAVILSRHDIKALLAEWLQAWNDHNLDVVMALFHDEVRFENWTGATVRGKRALRHAWAPWFQRHGGFRFTYEDLFIDEVAQKVLFQWRLEWPSQVKGCERGLEKRRGVDVIHFRDGKIIRKLTYSKTNVELTTMD